MTKLDRDLSYYMGKALPSKDIQLVLNVIADLEEELHKDGKRVVVLTESEYKRMRIDW